MEFEEQLFPEAAASWDVDKLYLNLVKAKQLNTRRETALTPVEKAILRGLLCGNPPKQIAAALHWTSRSLSVELTKGLYRYVETLTERDTNTLKNWRDIARWLEEAGYKAPKQVQNWGEAPDIAVFYGRKDEISQLQELIIQNECRLVALLGMGGIGKTALSVKLAKEIQGEFEYVIWRTIRHACPLKELLGSMLEFLTNTNQTQLPETTNSRISLLMQYLREHRCLIVWDGLEAILGVDQVAGAYQSDHEDYSSLLKRIAQEPHQSCLIFTSQEKPVDFVSLEGRKVKAIELGGLGSDAREILHEKGLLDTQCWPALIYRYQGNPLALKLVSATIKEVFAGSVASFLDQGTELGVVVPMFFQQLLYQQFQSLSSLEKQIMCVLAINRDPVPLAKLRGDIKPKVYLSSLTEALAALRRRSLLEITSEANKNGFTLQPMVMKYVIREYQSECQTLSQNK